MFSIANLKRAIIHVMVCASFVMLVTAFIGCKGSSGSGASGGGTLSSGLNLVWNPVTLDIEGELEAVASYNVYLSENSGAYYLAGTVTMTQAELENLETGSLYEVAITAVDASGNESELSNSITVQI